ncbi:5-hydroxytryptamine receptor 3A-like [Syngnathoides biaculeatus]|uniref:5-hydroxytryptamine receptor 3A-like n=1 Tax=Syngnathoides biaculeatus TaxID=300417 RepID=UPI002ADE54D7|nr:5-hydroxytryptamine receptor 3A-like [Syngnathoides biaculeatus]
MSVLRTVVLLTLAGNVPLACCSWASNCSYSALVSHLKLGSSNDFLANIRPVKHWKQVTEVQLDMLLYGILQVDEQLQTFTSHVWIQTLWKNDFLTWEPSDFCGIDHFSISRSMVWTPDIGIEEDASDSGSIKKSAYLTVYPNGMLQMSARQRLTSTCTLNLYNFPFDQQSCSITFSPMNTDAQAIHLGTISGNDFITNVSEQAMVTRGEWSLKELEIIANLSGKGMPRMSRLLYKVKIERKPMLYVIIFIVPLFYLLILDMASFFIHEGRGEKLSFKITVLLSISVLLLILKDLVPSTEDSLPLIANFSMGVFALVGLSVLEAMLLSFIIDLDDKNAKKPTRASDREVHLDKQETEGCTGKQPPPPHPSVSQDPAAEKAEGLPVPSGLPSEHEQLRHFLQEVRAAQQEVASVAVVPKPRRFRRVAEIIDIVFFILYISTIVAFLVVMYNVWIPADFYS